MQPQNSMVRALLVPLTIIAILGLTGCNGCSDQSKTVAEKKNEAEEKKKKERKPDYEKRLPVILPAVFPASPEPWPGNEDSDPTEKEKFLRAENNRLELARRDALRRNRAKLGHWVTTNFQLISNNFPTSGRLNSKSVSQFKSVRIPGTNYFVETSRPVSIPKGEWKSLESSVYLPRRPNATQANIDFQLKNASTGLTILGHTEPTRLMLSYQYHFIILSNRPDSYKYVNKLNSVSIPSTMGGKESERLYYVIPTKLDDPSPLARNALNWTTIAYILWDDYAPDQLDPEQQTALLDWLHHGGQLILSGPDCLDKTQSCFLSEFLPASFDSTFNITNEDLNELNEHWSITERKTGIKQDLVISEKAPLIGVKFKPHEESRFVDNTGEMAIERRIGRGRIVITGFSLDDRLLLKWNSFNSFFNGALLRKPSREFGETQIYSGDCSFAWHDDQTSILDPLVGSKLRYLSRDLGAEGTPNSHETSFNQNDIEVAGGQYTRESFFRIQGQSSEPERSQRNNVWQYGGYADDSDSGVAGWNDKSAVSFAARDTLRQAASISPPSSDFVLKMLAAYLFILVPLNWLVFRLIGKVEWAWVAAPIIAIAGAFTVVKLASLDIGFVRSNTQISLVEFFEGYERGHVAEYSALYTSLSTRYNLELDNRSAQSLPFSASVDGLFKPDETTRQVTLNRSRDNQIEGFQVRSNTTGLLHTEYTLDLGGRLELEVNDAGQYEINNGTNIDIRDAGVVIRRGENEYQFCLLSSLAPGARTPPLQFEGASRNEIIEKWSQNSLYQSDSRDADKIWYANVSPETTLVTLESIASFPELQDRWNEFSKAARQYLRRKPNSENLTSDELFYHEFSQKDFSNVFAQLNSNSGINLGRMFDAVVKNLQLEIGEMRLIGQTPQKIGATQFAPESTQTDRQTLLVVHLKKGDLPASKPDVNLVSDVSGLDILDSFEGDIDVEDYDTDDLEEEK